MPLKVKINCWGFKHEDQIPLKWFLHLWGSLSEVAGTFFLLTDISQNTILLRKGTRNYIKKLCFPQIILKNRYDICIIFDSSTSPQNSQVECISIQMATYDDTMNICKVATVDYEAQQLITSVSQVAPLSIQNFKVHVFIKGTH